MMGKRERLMSSSTKRKTEASQQKNISAHFAQNGSPALLNDPFAESKWKSSAYALLGEFGRRHLPDQGLAGRELQPDVIFLYHRQDHRLTGYTPEQIADAADVSLEEARIIQKGRQAHVTRAGKHHARAAVH